MAKTGSVSGAIVSYLSRGDDPPYPPVLACGQRRMLLARGRRRGRGGRLVTSDGRRGPTE
jgi:hypothetical protein